MTPANREHMIDMESDFLLPEVDHFTVIRNQTKIELILDDFDHGLTFSLIQLV